MNEPEASAPAATEEPRCGWRGSAFVFVAVTTAFAALLIAHNPRLFEEPIYEDGDAATNSLLVFKAKRLELLHGHYSRLEFYHPGPALLYVLAASEYLFHDMLGIVPAPHNAHILGQLILCAALIGVALTIVARQTNSRLAAVAAALVFLVYFAREAHLAIHWFAYLFFLVYLPFQVSAASVASGRVTHLGWLALTGSLAVHSHVSFVAFVVPISLYAVVRVWAKGGYRLRTLPVSERRAWMVFAAIIGLFVLPIALHVVLHYPGEIGRYLQYVRRPGVGGGSTSAVSTFLVRTLTHESSLGWPLALAVMAGALVAVLSFPKDQRSFPRQLGVVALLSTLAMVYYAARGVDDLQQTYIGVFFGSVLLLAWTLIGMRIGAALDCRPPWRCLALSLGAIVSVWAATTGIFTNLYPGSPEAPAVADAICTDPRWEGGPPALTLHHDAWPQVAALLVQMERRGKRPWLVDPTWNVILTDQFQLDGRPVTKLWKVDAALSQESHVGNGGTFGEFGGASFRAVETHVPFGQPVQLGQWQRPAGALAVTGWKAAGPLSFMVPYSNEATLLLDVANTPAREVRLTLRAKDIAPNNAPAGQRVRVSVNGEEIGEMIFDRHEEERSITFASAVLARQSPARITFAYPDARGYRTRRNPGIHEKYSVRIDGVMLTPLGP